MTGIITKSREEYDSLMEEMEGRGWHWYGGQKPTEYDGFNNVIEYHDRFKNGNLICAKLKGYHIVPFGTYVPVVGDAVFYIEWKDGNHHIKHGLLESIVEKHGAKLTITYKVNNTLVKEVFRSADDAIDSLGMRFDGFNIITDVHDCRLDGDRLFNIKVERCDLRSCLITNCELIDCIMSNCVVEAARCN